MFYIDISDERSYHARASEANNCPRGLPPQSPNGLIRRVVSEMAISAQHKLVRGGSCGFTRKGLSVTGGTSGIGAGFEVTPEGLRAFSMFKRFPKKLWKDDAMLFGLARACRESQGGNPVMCAHCEHIRVETV